MSGHLIENASLKGRPNTDFQHPYDPYEIQVDFMRKLYDVLENGRLGIFESPTGTGKSLSIICGAVTWLVEHEAKKRETINEQLKLNDIVSPVKKGATGFDWFDSYGDKKKKSDDLRNLKDEMAVYEKLDKAIDGLREIKKKKESYVSERSEIEKLFNEFKEVKCALDSELQTEAETDKDLALRDYSSDDENDKGNESEDAELNENDDLEGNVTKILYCSRTHSQLSQFVAEIQKTKFASELRVVVLGSRQNSCINDSVLKLKSLNAINDRCRELHKGQKGNNAQTSINGETTKKQKITNGCPFRRKNASERLGNNILIEVKDIEEMVKAGRKQKACPYYASRHAIPLAQLVVMPYNTLLHKSTRDTCGISLKNNVVIIDEAHNLLDAISGMHSSEISGGQLAVALSQLQQYKERYSSRLKAKNLLYVNQLLFVLKAFATFLKAGSTASLLMAAANPDSSKKKIMTLNDFVIANGIDNLNLFKILSFCKSSEISRKLLGFMERYQPTVKQNGSSEGAKSSVGMFLEKMSKQNIVALSYNDEDTLEKPTASSPLMQIEEFIRCLTNSNENGRIVINQQGTFDKFSMKYFLLNPAVHFNDIVAEARAVVVAGGTMHPVSEFSELLFETAGAKKERIVNFSCGHVTPANHILAISLSQGPSSVTFDFSFKNRKSFALMDELGRAIINLCNVVPGGLVCFFPSYDYASEVLSYWESKQVLNKMNEKKKVFQEPRKASQTSKILEEYSSFIKKSKSQSGPSAARGAILFSVVGGKMSEGINFMDDLGRCVVMVGMPYPNIKSPELQEKMNYLNQTVSKKSDNKSAGDLYYENLCMKAVNQSIGRAIRHKMDYATILLLDVKYSRPAVQNSLPGWVKGSVSTCQMFGSAFALIRKFFQEKCSY